jgi:hypothetical protein
MRVFLLGASPSISLPPDAHWEAKLAKTGGNTGNQIIAHSLLKQLRTSHVSWDYSAPPQEVGERFDMFVIAAANFLHPGCDLAGMANYIEATKLPCMMVGLGAQSNSYSTEIPLQPGTERLVRIVAERSHAIGVRGPFTHAVLEAKGIHNVQVTGCPSYYVSCRPELALGKPDLPENPRIAINASRDVYRHSFDAERMKHLVRELAAEGVAYGADFIAQSEGEEITLADTPSESERAGALERLARTFAGVAPDEKLRAWLDTRMRVFFSVEDWTAAIRSYDFVTGTRFHGCILALQNGVPAFVVCHDTRTADMCGFFGLPHASIMDIEAIDIRDLYARTDVAALQRRYTALYPTYKTFLDGNGLSHRLA